MRSKRLSRQLKKAFGTDSFDDRWAALREAVERSSDGASREELEALLAGVPDLLEAVEESYRQLDDKVAMASRSLEISSAELTTANSNLVQLNITFDAMVNSLGQGFFLFGADGRCASVFSKACESLLECVPAGRHVTDVLRVPEGKRGTFNDWCQMLFDEVLEFDDLVEIGPKTFAHSGRRVISLEFKAVRDREGKVRQIVVIATDRTDEIRAKQEAYKMHAFATMVTSILKDKNQFRSFVQVAREIIEDASRIVHQKGFDSEQFDQVKRGLHTLKGAAGSFGVLQVKDLIHEVETRIASENDLGWARAYLQGAIAEVRELFEELLGEHKELFDDVLKNVEPVREIPLKSLQGFASRLSNENLPLLRDSFIDEFVAVPVRRLLERFDALLADSAKKLGKRIEPIHFHCENIRLLPERLEELLSSLGHVFRNIADHAIEPEAERAAKGKVRGGQVWITAARATRDGRAALVLNIEDDGRGIDAEALLKKLKERGQAESLKGASRREILQKIFDAGLSTAKTVTDTSGRGVGLDAVKHEVEKLGGRITVDSEPGRGTRFEIVLPLESHLAPSSTGVGALAS